ncbi:hypothetical protein ElyMa_003861100 [Elysia marginata]|uniref:DH domain-containing protein n=1 Tax=Elysia marginata TaxID=1093978 RepID=A0AAV4FJG2_9GAST|nr:hypothetical protein ElyMa_003861100 [Elysia marginata]
MQSYSEESKNVLAELKNRKLTQTPEEAEIMASGLDAGHKPTMIFSSQNRKRGHKPRSEAFYLTQDTPSEIKSRWSSAMGNKHVANTRRQPGNVFLGGNQNFTPTSFQEERSQSTGVLVLSNETKRSKSSSPDRLSDLQSFNLSSRPSALSADRSKTTGGLLGKSFLLNTNGAFKDSRKRASPPPLIPPPASFSKRQGSVSSESFSSPTSTPHTSPRSPPPFPPASSTEMPLPPAPLPKLVHQDITPSEISKRDSHTPPTSPPTPPLPPPPQFQQLQSYVFDECSDLPLPPPPSLVEAISSGDNAESDNKTLGKTTQQIILPHLPLGIEHTSGISQEKGAFSNTKSKTVMREETDLLPAPHSSPQHHQPSPTPLTSSGGAGDPSLHISPLSSRLRDLARGGHNAGEVNLSPPGAAEGKPSSRAHSRSPSKATSSFHAILSGQGASSNIIENTQVNSHTLDIISTFSESTDKEGEFIDHVFSSILSQHTSEPDVFNMSSALTEKCSEVIYTQPAAKIEVLENNSKAISASDASHQLAENSLQEKKSNLKLEEEKAGLASSSYTQLPAAALSSQESLTRLEHESLTPVSLSSDNDETRDPQGGTSTDTTYLSKLRVTPPRRGRARKREVRPLKVTKLRPDVKTVREHIKKGTVDELATLFSQDLLIHPFSSNLTSEHFSSDTSRESLLLDASIQNNYGDYNEVIISETREAPAILEKITAVGADYEIIDSKSSHRESEDFSVERSLASMDNKALHSQDSDLTVEIIEKSENKVDFKDNKSSIEEEREGFDYLSASREIFKQVMRSDSKSPRNSLRKAHPHLKVNTIHSSKHGPTQKEEMSARTSIKTEAVNTAGVSSQKELDSSIPQGFEEDQARKTSSYCQDSASNTDDIAGESKQSVHTHDPTLPHTSAVLTSYDENQVPLSVSDPHVNITYREDNFSSQHNLLSESPLNVDEMTKQSKEHLPGIEGFKGAFLSPRQNTTEKSHSTKDDPTCENNKEVVLTGPAAETTYDYDGTNTSAAVGWVGGSKDETGPKHTGLLHKLDFTSLSPQHNNDFVVAESTATREGTKTETFRSRSDWSLWDSGSSERSGSLGRSNVNINSWTTTEILDTKTGGTTTTLLTKTPTTSNDVDRQRARVKSQLKTGSLSAEPVSPPDNTVTDHSSLTLSNIEEFKSSSLQSKSEGNNSEFPEKDTAEEDQGGKNSSLLLSSFSHHPNHVDEAVGGENEAIHRRTVVLHNSEAGLEDGLSLQTHSTNITSLFAHSTLDFESEIDEEDRLEKNEGEGEGIPVPGFQHNDEREENVRKPGLSSAGIEVTSVVIRPSELKKTLGQSEQLAEFRKINNNTGYSSSDVTSNGENETRDNFLSILDSIQLDGHSDLTSEFVGKSGLQRVYSEERSKSSSPEKREPLFDSRNVLQHKEIIRSLQPSASSEEVNVENSNKINAYKLRKNLNDYKESDKSKSSSSNSESEEGVKLTKPGKLTEQEEKTIENNSSTVAATTTTTTRSISSSGVALGDQVGDLEEELHLLHTSLSPQVSEHAVEEKLLPQAPEDDNISNIGSVSSRASNSGKLKETVFNSAFFTSGALITEGEEGEGSPYQVGPTGSISSNHSSKSAHSNEDSNVIEISNRIQVTEEFSDHSRKSSISSARGINQDINIVQEDIHGSKSREGSTSSECSSKERTFEVTIESKENDSSDTRSWTQTVKAKDITFPEPPAVFSEKPQRPFSVDLEENLITRDQFIATKSIFEKDSNTGANTGSRPIRKPTLVQNLSSSKPTETSSSYVEGNSSRLQRPPSYYSAESTNTDGHIPDTRDGQPSTFCDARDQVRGTGIAVTQERPYGHSPHPTPPSTASATALRQRQAYLDSDLDQKKQPLSLCSDTGGISNTIYKENWEAEASNTAYHSEINSDRKRTNSSSSSSSSSSTDSDVDQKDKREKNLKKRKPQSHAIVQSFTSHKDYFLNRTSETATSTTQLPFASETLQEERRRSSLSSDENSFKDVIDIISGYNDATTNLYNNNSNTDNNYNLSQNSPDTNGNMSAAVGELSTFAIHKKMTSEDKSISVTSDTSSVQHPPRTNNVVVQNGVDHDIYLIQDNNGDYYALQEVEGSAKSAPVGSNVTAHIINSSNVSSHRNKLHHSHQHSSVSTASPHSSRSSSIDYLLSSSSHQHEGGNLVIDGTAVGENKAREVISTFLESQEPVPSSSRYETEESRARGYYDSGSAEHREAYKQIHTQGDISADTGERLHYTQQLETNSSDRNVFINGHNTGNNAAKHNNITFYSPHIQSDALTNSTVTIQNKTNTRVDNSQVWTAPGFEPYTTGSGAQDHHSSSLQILNLNTPHQTVKVNKSNTPDYSWSDPGGVISTYNQPLAVNTTQNAVVQSIAPFQTTPISITTTTQAVVGETVDMQIDFPEQQHQHRVYQRQVSTTTEETSGDESSPQRFVVKNSPKKSSLKKTSKYDSSSLNDSGSDIVYTKKETVSADINIGGKSREIILHPVDDPYEDLSLSDARSSDANLYQVYNEGKPKPFQEVHTNREQKQDTNFAFTTRYNYERPSRSLPRSSSEHNLFDGHSSSEKGRGRTKHRIYSPREERGHGSDTGKSYRIRHSKMPHSPERFFKNPTLSLHRDSSDIDDIDHSRGYHSEIDISQPKKYKMITKVVVDGEEERSRSTSPTSSNRYRVTNAKTRSASNSTHGEIEEKQGQTRYRVLYANNSRKDSSDLGNSFKENRKRYRVFGQSDSALNVSSRQDLSTYDDRAHNRSIDEATITRTARVQPSRLSSQPHMGKSHKTVIQLEVDKDKRIRQRDAQNGLNQEENRYSVKHSRSLDDALSPTIVQVNTAPPPSQKAWRIEGVSSGSLDSDYHMSDSMDNDHPTVKTLQQKSGNKRYVVHSTVGDPHDEQGNVLHLPGWHKSTIDINEDHPRQMEQSKSYKIFNRSLDEEMLNSQSYKTEKSVYFVRQVSDNATIHNKLSQRSQSTEFVSPDSGQGTEVASTDGENETLRQKFERVERIYEVRSEPQMPEHFTSTEDLSNDLRVLRGKILIKNRLDDSEHGDDDFDENANLFDTSFHLGKDNPLYSSDQDLLESIRREEKRELAQQVTQDITYDHVERIAQRHRTGDGQGESQTQASLMRFTELVKSASQSYQ